MNIVVLQGNLAEDTKSYTTANGIKIVKGVIACSREFSKKKECDFINFTVMGNSSDFAEKYGKKGVKTLIRGTWNHSGFKDKDGNYKVNDCCLVEKITFFDKVAKEKVESETKPQDIADDDLPF